MSWYNCIKAHPGMRHAFPPLLWWALIKYLKFFCTVVCALKYAQIYLDAMFLSKDLLDWKALYIIYVYMYIHYVCTAAHCFKLYVHKFCYTQTKVLFVFRANFENNNWYTLSVICAHVAKIAKSCLPWMPNNEHIHSFNTIIILWSLTKTIKSYFFSMENLL